VKRRVEQIVVVGADAPAWLAAAAIHSSFGGRGVRIRVVELPSLLRPVDVYSALPALAGLHDRLGLEEDLLFSVCKAVPVAGQRLSNWSGAGAPFLRGYDDPPPVGGGDLSFTQFWIKGRQQGLRTAFENFSPGAMAAKAGRVPIPTRRAELRSAHGYELDAVAYSALLKHFVTRGGIEWKSATIADVDREGDRITALVLADGERIEADLFVDASGPQGVLIGHMPDTEFESWREWLPCDQMLVASAKALQPRPGFSQISAFRQGWVGMFPLQDRTAVAAAFDSREISAEDLLAKLPVLAGMSIGGEAVVSSLAPGIRKRTWVGNCVAVGESAFALESLDAVQLHITHACISHLMTLFPVEAVAFPEAELYDAILRRAAVNLRDFQAAHYKLNRRFDEPLWDRCRETAAPDTLQRKLDVFAARGRIPLYDDETFLEPGWESLFIGHGLIPQSYDPRVDGISDQDQIAAVHARLQDIVELVGAMPAIDQFLSCSPGEMLTERAHSA
jgi:tryptophan halogenase